MTRHDLDMVLMGDAVSQPSPCAAPLATEPPPAGGEGGADGADPREMDLARLCALENAEPTWPNAYTYQIADLCHDLGIEDPWEVSRVRGDYDCDL